MARPKKPPIVKLMEGGRLMPSRDAKSELMLDDMPIPPPPGHLDETEKGCWLELARSLDSKRLATASDLQAFELLATAFAEWRHAAQAVRDLKGELSYTTESRDGSILHRAYPEYGTKSEVERRFLALLGRWGMTPADRASLAIKSKGQDEPEDTERGKKLKQFA